jgi:TonB family protein
MSAHRSKRCAVGRAILVLIWIALTLGRPGIAQQALPAAIEQPHMQVSALAERLAAQLLAANKKKPFILDLTLPNDLPCPLGVWLADQLSQSLSQSHPELEVIPRKRWSPITAFAENAHDRNQEYILNEERAQALGAEVLVQGNFAAIPDGIGITLMGSDRLSGGESKFEALAEIPFTPEMQSILTTILPQRPSTQGAFKASVAGIGSPMCAFCPAPQYTYVAKAKKLQGVVIAQVWVTPSGEVQETKIVRAPNPDLAKAAMHTLRNWRFKPAHNAHGEFVSVLVDVAVSFRLDILGQPSSSAPTTTAASKKF